MTALTRNIMLAGAPFVLAGVIGLSLVVAGLEARIEEIDIRLQIVESVIGR
jgi:hypothetical protein